ncbi:hypothetical protein ACOSP7_026591 [Xanthoceras sorbifolium]
MSSATQEGEKNETVPTKTMTEKSVDNMDSFTLHHSDHPDLVLVSKILEGDNYGQWSYAMQIALSAKNKIGFINGTIQAPPQTDRKFSVWQRCNHMVLSWNLNSVWNDLRDRFSQGNDSRIYQIRQDITEQQQGQQSISAYYTKMKSLWDELASYHDPITCTYGGLKNLAERKEKEMVMQFLMGLNESYATVRGSILMMSPLPDTRKVHALVLQQERQIEVAARRENTSYAAMQTSKIQQGSYSGSFIPSEAGRSQDKKRTTITGKKKNCSFCGRDYHIIDRCYYIPGFPQGHKLHGKDVEAKRKETYCQQFNNRRELRGTKTYQCYFNF